MMRWPGRDPRPNYASALLQQLHLQPIAALEVLTALADHLTGRSSVVEIQVEGWGSIDSLSPAPLTARNSQSPSRAPPPPPRPPTLVPKLAP